MIARTEPYRPSLGLLFLTAFALAESTLADKTYLYAFGQDVLDKPEDVAAYSTCASGEEYVFVADPGRGELVRFDRNGDDTEDDTVSAPAFGPGPYGVAVDDSTRSPNFGQVYTTTQGTPGLVWIYKDTSLANTSDPTDGPTCMSIEYLDGQGGTQVMRKPHGIAVDLDGNLYVVDTAPESHPLTVLKVDAADVAHVGELCITRTASLAIESIWGTPIDVSVDKSGRIHVANDCGCVEVFYPSGVPFLANPIFAPVCKGVDAKDDRLRTRVARTADVKEYDHQIIHESFSDSEVYGTMPDPRGLEYQDYLRTVGSTRRWEERVFVADSGGIDGKIFVFGEDFDSTTLPHGAIAWWQFEESPWVDSVGGDNNLVFDGDYQPGQGDGHVRCSMDFSAEPAGAMPWGDSDFDFGEGNFSLEAWICAELESGVATFLEKGGAGFGDTEGYELFLDDGYLAFRLASTQIGEKKDSDFVADGKWHHVAVSVMRTLPGQERIRLYVDGVPTSESSGTIVGSASTTWGLRVGYYGRLDEVAIYGRALSACEIAKLHHAQGAGKHGFTGNHHFCVAETSNSGCLPSMDFSGSASVTDADLLLFAKSVDAGAVGMLLYSTVGEAWIPFQDGVLCIQAPVRRTYPVLATGGGDCDGTLTFPMGGWMSSGYDPNLLPGTGVWAQFMYRDPVATGPKGTIQMVPFVLTDAVHFTILP